LFDSSIPFYVSNEPFEFLAEKFSSLPSPIEVTNIYIYTAFDTVGVGKTELFRSVIHCIFLFTDL
jgi:hypothetical protein